MTALLKELELEELSLVDIPANAQAMVSLFKRHTEEDKMETTLKMSDKMKERMKYFMEEKGMSEEDAMKACKEEMEKAWDLKEENQKLRKFLIENDFVIKADSIEKKETMETIKVGEVEVNKADVPEAILKAYEEAQAEIAKAKAEAAEVEIEKRVAAELPHWDKDAAKEILKAQDWDEKILEALKAADEAFEMVMAEKGDNSANEDLKSAEEKLEEAVKAYKDEHKVSYEKAYSVVIKTDEGKSLFKAMKEDK